MAFRFRPREEDVEDEAEPLDFEDDVEYEPSYGVPVFVNSEGELEPDIYEAPVYVDEDCETLDDYTAEGLGIGEITIEDVDDEY